MQHTGDAIEVAQQATDVLLQTLPTLAADAEENAVLDALPAPEALDTNRWMRLKRQIKNTVPVVNLHALERTACTAPYHRAAGDSAASTSQDMDGV